jgi:hypothetical protein
MCMYIHTHLYIHIYAYLYIHKCKIYIYIRTHIHTHTHTKYIYTLHSIPCTHHPRAYIRIYINNCVYIHAHKYLHSHINRHTHNIYAQIHSASPVHPRHPYICLISKYPARKTCLAMPSSFR